jgi:hypothetical protein
VGCRSPNSFSLAVPECSFDLRESFVSLPVIKGRDVP